VQNQAYNTDCTINGTTHREVRKMPDIKAIVIFLVGMAVGMVLHRLIMAIVLEKHPNDICTYCEWADRKRSRYGR